MSGTIVVSDIFNQFVIYAGAVLAGKTNILLKWVFVCLYVYGTSENVPHKFAFNIFSHLNEVCDNELQLNPLIVLREAFFYGLSIAYLLFALSRKEIVDDDVEYEPHIIITVLKGGLLLSGYLFYVIVCANFDKIINFCTCLPLFAELLCRNLNDAMISPNK